MLHLANLQNIINTKLCKVSITYTLSAPTSMVKYNLHYMVEGYKKVRSKNVWGMKFYVLDLKDAFYSLRLSGNTKKIL